MAEAVGPQAPAVTAAAVEDILQRVFSEDKVAVGRLEPISAGASRLSWFVDVSVNGEPSRLVLQRERARGRGRSDVVKEAALLRAGGEAGVPVPAVVTSDADGDEIGGAYLVTARVDGETLPRRILRQDRFAGARASFARECGEILGRIHTIPLDELPDLDQPDPLDAVAEMLDGTGERRPGFEAALRWLRDHPPAPRPPALVHGDFRNGNFIVDESGIRAVLDWELAHIGNPIQDLGWLCARPWRWGAPAPVGGVGELDDLLAAYQPYGGAVGRDELRWWLLHASLSWGVMCLEQARVHLSGEHRSAELAVLGRISAEMEYDVLRTVRDAR